MFTICLSRMNKWKTFIGVLLLSCVSSGLVGSNPCTAAPSQTELSVFIRGQGRAQEIVVYDLETRTERYLTNNDVWDGLPVLSPSGQWLAFVRATPKRDVMTRFSLVLHEADEIIVVDPRSGDVLCSGKSDHTEPYELGRCAEYWPDVPPLAGVINLCWTQDETGILFEAPCSVTNDLILRMDIPSGEIHILCLGNDLRAFGQDHFLIWRHEYDEGGGCDHYYVIDPWGTLAPDPLPIDRED